VGVVLCRQLAYANRLIVKYFCQAPVRPNWNRKVSAGPSASFKSGQDGVSWASFYDYPKQQKAENLQLMQLMDAHILQEPKGKKVKGPGKTP
jgi:hypothetical protein